MKTIALFLISLFVSNIAFSKTINWQSITLAGGCFWCMEPPFEKLDGVKSVISGYMGGSKEDAHYKIVSSGSTKHLEVVQVTYDPAKISTKKILDIFWHNIDPTDDGGQFVDRGDQYKSAIFYHSKEQKEMAIASKKALEQAKVFKTPIVTAIRMGSTFYPAEEYHQDYYKKNPIRYKFYRYRSGRDQFLEKTWKKK